MKRSIILKIIAYISLTIFIFLSDDDKPFCIQHFNQISQKGNLGNLIEQFYFLYDINNQSETDFKEAGIELKVTPYKKNKNNKIRTKERLVFTMINYLEDYLV